MEGFVIHVANKLAEIRFGKPKDVSLFSLHELKTWVFWRGVLAEGFATSLFVYMGCSSTILLDSSHSANILQIALAFGLSIMVLIQIFGPVSGAHINPAVSVGFAVGGVITPIRAILYVVAQTVGAILGGLLLKGLTPSNTHTNLGVTSLNSTLNVGQGLGVEIILTFVLMSVIIATTDSNRHEYGSKSLAIGLTVTTGHLAGIRFTGSSMNPARSLGSAVASNSYLYHWIYWLGPIIGACVAALVYRFIFSPYRGGVSMDEAVQRLLSDENFLVIPKEYFKKDNSQNGKTTDTSKL